MDQYHVCLINDSFPPAIDGVANAVLNYGTIIQNNLGSASVVTPYYPAADDSVYPFDVVRYPSLDTTKFVGYRTGLPFSKDVMQQLESRNFDVIHSHCPITSTMLARALRDRVSAPVVFTYHTKFDVDIAHAIHGRLLRAEAAAILAENISACDEVWTVSRGAAENLQKLGYSGSSIVMPNGVDLPRGRVSDAQIAEATAAYSIPDGVPVFLFVGRMMWYKGIRIILDALKRLDDTGKKFCVVFIGGGGDEEQIQHYCASLQLTQNVIFVKPIHDRETIRAWYCRADLFLFPSTFDTNGLVVREAAACGLASVLIAGSCAAEDVKADQNGLLIEENAEAMAAVLEKMMTHPEEMKRLGENAQRELYLSWEDAVKHAYERYGIVIENYKSGKYPAHNKITDEFFRTIGDSLDTLINLDKLHQAHQNERKEERQRIWNQLTEQRRKIEEFAESYMDRFL